jgi:phage terminase Nu1 subunit (DNA packaging protein)
MAHKLKRKKDLAAAAERQLRGNSERNEYADARTLLALEQTRRIAQLRKRDEGELIPADEVRRLLVNAASAFRARLLGIAQRLRSQYPSLDKGVYEFLAREHADALKLTEADSLKADDE